MPPTTSLELVEENPFLQFAEAEVIGNYTFPFEAPGVPPNMKLTNYAGVFQKRIDNTGIDARLIANGLQHSVGKIKVEKPQHNLNHPQQGKVSYYYLIGASSFYQDVKDKKMREINVGGVRSFDWDAYATTGSGFWGHIHDVVNEVGGPYDYAFYPVKNTGWQGFKTSSDIMNLMIYDAGMVKFSRYTKEAFSLTRDANVIVPFPYLKYVMQQAAAEVGWTINGDILDDADFEKVTLINFQSIHWALKKGIPAAPVYIEMDPVTFNLQDNLPDITVGDFFLSLKNRFGWWYDFDFISKKITIRSLQDTAVGEVKEFTRYASPLVTKKVTQERKVYAIKNIFSTDIGNGAPSFKSVSLQGQVDEVTDLPAVTDARYGHVYLVVAENNYYICALNEDTGNLEWTFYAYNIYDYEPADANEEVQTSATTVGVEKYNDYLDLIPRIDNNGNWFGRTDIESSWGVILCFYHGLRDNKAADPYPYASSHIFDSTFTQVAEWALTFECKKSDATDVGLYEKNWKKLLLLLSSPEEFEATLYLPIHEWRDLKFSDRIIIDGVMMFLKQKKSQIEYKNEVQIEAVRII